MNTTLHTYAGVDHSQGHFYDYACPTIRWMEPYQTLDLDRKIASHPPS